MEPTPRVAAALQCLKGAFLENPGTRLTLADAAQLSGLDSGLCNLVLVALEDVRFLERGGDGIYLRRAADWPE